MNKRIQIAGVPFDAITYEKVLEEVSGFISQNKKAYITTPNPEMVLNADRDKKFANVLNNANLSIPDGIGILWASYYLHLPHHKYWMPRFFQLIASLFSVIFSPKKIRKRLPERVTGSDLFYKIVEQSQEHKWKIYLLGAKTGVAHKAINKLLTKYPKAIFAGSYAGSPSKDEENDICEMINHAKPDILFVAYGSPAQELWIYHNLFKLDTVKLAVGVGGAFDFAAGVVKRAPRFMQQIGLEWLWRLIKEPKRIKRIWNATFVFIGFIFRTKKEN
ncbi:WecB/TagA/CpsF family glycosyltransferase [Patescibacteria group bacterium]|nr:WecB/TagA/CpsF family glycosyltransferase [Patescibacteria group bacterium]MBU1682966.1 WecB/TagA/CpsF family glycosyltransferase [Patescibacteria group bacterium]MBU1934878.1 WecB/TagA/CpsF family glycosyltransferase [Patescibacteria group bacterium]